MGLWPHRGVPGGAAVQGLQRDPSECLEEKRLLVLVRKTNREQHFNPAWTSLVTLDA